MLLSLAIIFLAGLFAAAVFERIGLPRIIGMLGVGIVVSPYVSDCLMIPYSEYLPNCGRLRLSLYL